MTHCRLKGPGIETWWGGFLHLSRLALGPAQPSGPRSLSGGKAARMWQWPPPISSAKFKVRVELHLYTPSGPSWHVPGSTWPFISHSISHIINISYSSQTLINNITDHIKSRVCVLLLCLFELHPFSFTTTTLIVILLPLFFSWSYN